MKEFDLLIFDLDGTLLDTKGDLALAVNLCLKELGFPEREVETIYSYIGDGVRKLLGKAIGIESGPEFENAIQVFRRHYLNHLVDSTTFYPGVEEVLKYYEQKHRAVVTNKPADYTSRIMDGLKIRDYFTLIVGSLPETRLKPDPQMLLEVIEDLEVAPERTLMIGDGVNDIQAARSAGASSCAVGYGLTQPDRLKAAQPDYYCDDILQIRNWIK
ncbi:MAG: HAD-IA family hydrolase [Nitrospirae bacterium]|nr:HAD-IA family hydrolase [Nitrospirota bacterium]MBI3593964.1 HAD-IA family hydrolase [Nitrospirota bacterium]